MGKFFLTRRTISYKERAGPLMQRGNRLKILCKSKSLASMGY